MSSAWNFVFGFILIIIWVTAGVFCTLANVHLTSYKNKDEFMHRAYWFTFWGAFVTWTLLIIFIILIILSVIGVVALFGSGVGEAGVAAEGAEGVEAGQSFGTSPQGQGMVKQGMSWATIGFLVLAIILVSITGVLAAISAAEMIKSPNYDDTVPKLTDAHTDCTIAAIICIAAVGILFIGVIVYLIIGEQRKKKIAAREAIIKQQEAIEAQGLKRAQAASLQEKLTEQQEFQEQLKSSVQQALIQKIYQKAGVAPAV